MDTGAYEELALDLFNHITQWKIDSKSILPRFGNLTKNIDWEAYFQSIVYSHLFEQYWATLGFLEETLEDEVLKQQAREHFESYDFSRLGLEKHQETFGIMHKATLFSDNDQSIDNTESDSCSHELGCIGGDGLEGTPRMNKFLKSISKKK